MRDAAQLGHVRRNPLSLHRSEGAGGRVARGSIWVVGGLALGLLLAGASAAQTSGGATAAPAAAQAAAPDSVRDLEVAVEKDTTSFDTSYRLGVAYLDRDRAFEAVGVFQRCTRLRPDEVKAWVNLGAALDAIGKGPDARVAYRSALTKNPGDEIALCRLSASLYASGDKTAAMDTLRLALAQHPRSYCAYFTLGVAFADAQMYHEAIRAWEKVVEVAPQSPEALSAKESIATLRELMNTP